MSQLSPGVLTVLVLVALGLALLALLGLAATAPRRRQQHSSMSGDPAAMVLMHDQLLADVRGAIAQLQEGQRRLAEAQLGFVQRTGLVRYNAFDDMGGQLSFSVALLDAYGSGVVITSINGRQDTRCYAKPVAGGTSQHNLTTEEQQAIEHAMSQGGAPAEAGAGSGGGRRRVRRGA